MLRLYTGGNSYQEIADRLGRHTKAVDNALQRVKRKMETQINALSRLLGSARVARPRAVALH